MTAQEKRKRNWHGDVQRGSNCEDRSRDGSHVSVSQGMPRIASSHQKLEGRQEVDSLLAPACGTKTATSLTLGLLLPPPPRGNAFLFHKPHSCWHLLWSHRKLTPLAKLLDRCSAGTVSKGITLKGSRGKAQHITLPCVLTACEVSACSFTAAHHL